MGGPLCGYNEFERDLPAPLITSSNVIEAKIFTDATAPSDGFQFILTPINADSPAVVQNSDVSCNGQVLSQNLVCDGEINCFDQSDEPADRNVDAEGLCPASVFSTPAG